MQIFSLNVPSKIKNHTLKLAKIYINWCIYLTKGQNNFNL